MSYASAYEQLRRLTRAAGVPGAERIHPHNFRHTFATEALDAGAALQDVQDALGHADPAPPAATTAPATGSTKTPPTLSPPRWAGCSPRLGPHHRSFARTGLTVLVAERS